MKLDKVIVRSIDHDGKNVGTYNINGIVSTQVYKVMLPGVAIHKYLSDFIAENLYIQVDD